jgi:hypothetical protein
MEGKFETGRGEREGREWKVMIPSAARGGISERE